MELNIEFEALEPPEGWTHPKASSEREHFAGWLELMGVIERFVQRSTSQPGSTPSDGNEPSIDREEQR